MSRHEGPENLLKRLEARRHPPGIVSSAWVDGVPRTVVLACSDCRLPRRIFGIPLDLVSVTQTLGAEATEGALAVLAGACADEPLELAIVLSHDDCCLRRSRLEQRAASRKTAARIADTFGERMLVVVAHLDRAGRIQLILEH